MSFEALAAVADAPVAGSTALLLLYILAEFADEDGLCFPSQATLAERSRLSVRAVRDNLCALENQGVIATESRYRKDGTRSSNEIRLRFYTPRKLAKSTPCPPADTAAGETVKRSSRSKAKAGSVHRQNMPLDYRQQTPGLPAAAAGLTTFDPVTEPREQEDKSSRSQRARAGEAGSRFDEALAAYPASGAGITSRPAALVLWHSVGAIVGAERLLAAVRAYAADPGLKRRDFGAPSLQKWLSEGRYQRWLDQGGEAAKRTAFAGPPVLRAMASAARGEAWVVAYLDPAGWMCGVLVARTGTAERELTKARREGVFEVLVTGVERKAA